MAQTSYTWNGGTSTDFATGTNWTPNGVPGSGDNITIVTGSNTCKLDGNRTVNNLTMTSGTLDLETYTITVGNNSTLNGGTVEDGELTMSSGTAKFAGATLDCKVDVTGNITQVYDTHFKDSVALDETDAGGYYMRGCIFDDFVEITNSSTGYVRTGNNQPDTFRLKAVFNIEAAGYIVICHGATTNHFEDDVVLNNNGGNTGRGFMIGGNANAVIDFLGDVEMNVTAGSGYIKFNLGDITHSGNLTIGGTGYNSGLLTLKGYAQDTSLAIDLSSMSGTSSLDLGPDLTLEGDLTAAAQHTKIYSGCHFKGDVTLPDVRTWNGAQFDGVTDINVTIGNVFTGGNTFNDTTKITYSGTGNLYTGNNAPDTALKPLTFELSAAGGLTIGHGAHANYYADKVTLTNNSGNASKRISLGGNTSAINTFDGDIELNVGATSGDIRFWLGTTHNGVLRIGIEGYNNGTLTLRNYEQTASGTIDLTEMDSDADLDVLIGTDIKADFFYGGGGTATLTNALFRDDATIESSSLPVTDCTFYGTTYLEKTGGVNNLNDGNAFYGNTTIENSSSANYLYWGNSVADTFMMDLTLINRSTQPLWINYASEGTIGGDLTLDGDSASVIRLGGAATGRITVFDGNTDQYLYIIEEDLDVQVYRVEVNKSGGRLKLNRNITATHELTLTDGIIECWNNAVITLNDGVEPTASDSSYVEGDVQKIGNDAFDFPIGMSGKYRPISISAPGDAADAFTASYMALNSDPINSHDDRDGSLDHLSINEYWILTRDVGTSTPVVTIGWDSITSCSTDGEPGDYHVAGWDGSNWDDLGNGATTGSSSKGTVSTASGVDHFEMFILESDSIMDCFDCHLGDTLGSADTILTNIYIDTEPIWYSFIGTGQEIITFETPDSVPVAHIDSVTIYRDCYRGYKWVQRTDTLGDLIEIDTLFDVGVAYFIEVHADTSGYFSLSRRGGALACNGAAPVVSAASYSATVPIYGLQEIVFDVEVCSQNGMGYLFDYDHIYPHAVFTHPESGYTVTVDGFYMENITHNCDGSNYENLSQVGTGSFKVRFTPHLLGDWYFQLKVEDDDPGLGYSSIYQFEVEDDPEAKGFVRMNQNTGYTFREYTGEVEVTVGCGMAWDDSDDCFEATICSYEHWIDDLADNAGNHIRVWSDAYWGLGIESQQDFEECPLNGADPWNSEYRDYGERFQDRAYELDQIIKYSGQRDVSVKLTLNVAANYAPWHWENHHPYYRDGNGVVGSRSECFLVNGPAWGHFLNRHRYTVARWGYAVNLHSWEMFNENFLIEGLDSDPQFAQRMIDWNGAITDEIRKWDPYDHLITTSSWDPDDTDDLPEMEEFMGQVYADEDYDYTAIHSYNHIKVVNGVIDDDTKRRQQLKQFEAIRKYSSYTHGIEVVAKPTIVNEFLWHNFQDAKDWDPKGFLLHHCNWVNFCGGAMGPSMGWHWNKYIDNQDLWYQYDGLSRFISEVEPYLTNESVDSYQTCRRAAHCLSEDWFLEVNEDYRWTYSQNSEVVFGHVQAIAYDWEDIYDSHNDYLLSFTGSGPTMVDNSNAELTISDLETDMLYSVRWYSTETGVPFYENFELSNSSGQVDIVLPLGEDDFKFGDAAFILLGCGIVNPANNLEYSSGSHLLNDHIAEGDIVVKNGAELRLTGVISFSPLNRIIVEQGGKLVVDGATLTDACDMTWKGIQVWGDRYGDQDTLTGSDQGILVLKNGAQIENARVGVDVVDLTNVGSTSGGVVRANNATFLNCVKAVSFGQYEQDNISYFRNVHVLANAPINDLSYGGNTTGQMVSIWGTYGIEFTDCTFEFDHDNPSFETPLAKHLWPTGIVSESGGFRLQAGSSGGNLFKNLQFGLSLFDFFSPVNKIRCSNSTFENVLYGSFSHGLYNAKFDNNTFKIPDADENIDPYGYFGWYNAAYELLGNTFTSLSGDNTEGAVGVVTRGTAATIAENGGWISNDNRFEKLERAYQAELTNSYLQVRCNDFDGNSFDWILNPGDPGFFADQGIGPCPQAGSTIGERAGNRFINHWGKNLFEGALLDQPKYYAADGGGNDNQLPESFESDYAVDVEECDITVLDPTCSNVDPPPLESEEERFENQQMWDAKAVDLDTVLAYLDSSQTQMLLDTVYNLNTNDTILTTILKDHSPLSDTVLTAYLVRDTTKTEPNFRDVWLKNLPAAKPVWNGLLVELDALKDQAIEDTLRGAQTNNPLATTVTALAREIRYYAGRTHAAADRYVMHYVGNDSLDFVKPYMDTVGLYPLRLALLGAEITDRNWDEADSSLAKLPLTTSNDTAVYDLYQMRIDLGRDTLSLFDLSSADSTRVWEIANDTMLDASLMAKGMLTVMLDTLFIFRPEPFELPSGRMGIEEDEDLENETEEFISRSPTESEYFRAYPNPFSNSTTIKYDLGKDCEQGCKLRLYDLQGREIFAQILYSDDGKGTVVVDMSRYNNGLYYCSLYGNQQLLQTEKLILMR